MFLSAACHHRPKLARSHFDSSSELSVFNFVMANALKALLEGDMPMERSRSPVVDSDEEEASEDLSDLQMRLRRLRRFRKATMAAARDFDDDQAACTDDLTAAKQPAAAAAADDQAACADDFTATKQPAAAAGTGFLFQCFSKAAASVRFQAIPPQ